MGYTLTETYNYYTSMVKWLTHAFNIDGGLFQSHNHLPVADVRQSLGMGGATPCWRNDAATNPRRNAGATFVIGELHAPQRVVVSAKDAVFTTTVV